MKAAMKSSWIAKSVGMVLTAFLGLPVYAQLMLAHEGHHSGGDCSIKTGDFHVSFSAYEVPEGGIPPLHAYCTSIPKTGKVSLTIEIPPPAREMLLAVRLVNDDHSGHGGHTAVGSAKPAASQEKPVATSDEHEGHEGHDDHENHMMHDEHAQHGTAEHGLSYLPPSKHKSGIIVLTATLQEKGHYAILLEKHEDSGNVKTAVKIPLSVGMGGGHGSHGGGIGMTEILLLILVAGGGAAYYFMRHKKTA